MILSTGMATLAEIENALAVIALGSCTVIKKPLRKKPFCQLMPHQKDRNY